MHLQPYLCKNKKIVVVIIIIWVYLVRKISNSVTITVPSFSQNTPCKMASGAFLQRRGIGSRQNTRERTESLKIDGFNNTATVINIEQRHLIIILVLVIFCILLLLIILLLKFNKWIKKCRQPHII